MSNLDSELKVNYSNFRSTLRKDFIAADKAIDADGKVFFDAYIRLAVINSWRADVLAHLVDSDVLAFMLESQSDGVSSLAFATVGAWRTSLQALRSMIENAMLGLYFADHLVEHKLWLSGNFKIGFTSLAEYFKVHPAHKSIPNQLDPIPSLCREYETLSSAVHGRAPFRMTKDSAATVVCNPSVALRGAYLSRQRETLRSLSLLHMMLFATHLEGTKQPALRAILTHTLPSSLKTVVRTHYKVILI